jgi:hypothetical protein
MRPVGSNAKGAALARGGRTGALARRDAVSCPAQCVDLGDFDCVFLPKLELKCTE